MCIRDRFRDDLTTNPVTSVYAALGRLKAEYPALSWGEVKELQQMCIRDS